MPNDVEHISHVYNLNGEIQVFGLFLNYSSFESSLYILNTSSLSISHWQVLFSPSVACLSLVVFWKAKAFNFDEAPFRKKNFF